ncbi:MAG: GntR family transcriptional regulator [Rhodospirillales bacterium]
MKQDEVATVDDDAQKDGSSTANGAAPTLTERAYQVLEELIVTLELPPGAVLSEQALVKRLGIGRTPIREALQRLALESLVTILPRRGVLVSEIDLRRQLRVLELRRELERFLANKASERATDAQRERLREIAQGMREAAETSDGIAFMRLDRELNLLVAAAAHNEFANRSVNLLHGLSRRFWYQHYKQVADLPLTARLHADLSQAIADADKVAATKASDALIDYIETFARKTLEA